MSDEQPSVEALVERVRQGMFDVVGEASADALAALDSLTAALTETQQRLQDCYDAGEHAVAERQAALERAERERADALDFAERETAKRYAAEARAQKAEESARKFAAEAFSWQDAAQKAEAVVEAAREAYQAGEWADTLEVLGAALTAYDKPPTEQA